MSTSRSSRATITEGTTICISISHCNLLLRPWPWSFSFFGLLQGKPGSAQVASKCSEHCQMQHLTLRGIFKGLEYYVLWRSIHYTREGQSESPGPGRCFSSIFLWAFVSSIVLAFCLKNRLRIYKICPHWWKSTWTATMCHYDGY